MPPLSYMTCVQFPTIMVNGGDVTWMLHEDLLQYFGKDGGYR